MPPEFIFDPIGNLLTPMLPVSFASLEEIDYGW